MHIQLNKVKINSNVQNLVFNLSTLFLGIARSNTYGVAKAANAISVRVLDSFGFGSYTYVALI